LASLHGYEAREAHYLNRLKDYSSRQDQDLIHDLVSLLGILRLPD